MIIQKQKEFIDSLEKNIDLGYEIDTSNSVFVSHINGFNTAGFPNTEFMLRFKYINGVFTLTEKDPSVVLTDPELDNKKPITQYPFTDTITNNPNNLILNYNFHDGEYLETEKYGNIFPFYYDFYSGHFLDSGYFQIDNQNITNFNFSRERDQSTRIYPIYNQSGEIPLDKSEGEHQVIVNITDYSGNTKKDTINYIMDLTPSEINIIYPEADKEYVGSVDSMVVAVTDAHPGDTVNYTINETDYSVAHSDTITVSTTSVEGQNTYSVSALDQAGNPSYAEINFNVSPDAVEEKKEPKTLEDYFKAYPNPTNSIVNFEFNLDAPQNLRFSISDIAGRQLEQRVIEGNFGENKVSYDFSKYGSKLYLYRIEGEEGKIKTGRVVRR